MAQFSFDGVDGLAAGFEKMANLSDQDRMDIIMTAAKLLAERQKQKILDLFTQWSGALANSITIEEKSDEDGVYAHIYLKGKHPGSGTGKRKRKNGRSNGKYSGTNAEIGYILEYGSPRIAARHWMENANEEAEAEIVEAMQAAFNDILQTKGL